VVGIALGPAAGILRGSPILRLWSSRSEGPARRGGLADLAGAIPAGCALQSELLERAAACGRLTVAEVTLGTRNPRGGAAQLQG